MPDTLDTGYWINVIVPEGTLTAGLIVPKGTLTAGLIVPRSAGRRENEGE